ncbi:MAG: inositol monophosphatase family protein [Desulfomonilia bacterium]|jgi:myo-inositol-1(or 4)-monophosphatase
MKYLVLTRVAMLNFALNLAKKAGEYLKESFGKELNVEHKGRIDLVTQIDRNSQDMILDGIEREFPHHSIMAEEGVSKTTGHDYTWFVDPLDGTVNFVHGIPFFCVSLGVFKRGKPFIGVCYNPMSGDLFSAQYGKGAFRNREKIRVSDTSLLIDALVVTGFPYSLARLDDSMSRFARILSEVQGIRRFGSAALDLCFVASGSFDGFWEVGLHPWDLAGGVVVLLEAGGRVTGLSGEEFDPHHGDILASNGNIHNDLRRLMQGEPG